MPSNGHPGSELASATPPPRPRRLPGSRFPSSRDETFPLGRFLFSSRVRTCAGSRRSPPKPRARCFSFFPPSSDFRQRKPLFFSLVFPPSPSWWAYFLSPILEFQCVDNLSHVHKDCVHFCPSRPFFSRTTSHAFTLFFV